MECKDGMVDRFSGNRSRINRNIMECKGMSKQLGAYGTQVLIETLWNVKVNDSGTVFERVRVLIETLWNVKECRNKSNS